MTERRFASVISMGPIAKWVVVRIAAAFALIFGLVLFLFVLIRLAPGDPIQAMVGEFPVPDEYREQMVREYGLDRSIFYQFWAYVSHLIRGDLGYSYAGHQSVAGLIFDRLPNTLLLTGVGLAAAALIGVTIGTLSAVTRFRGLRGFIDISVVLAFSLPTFWLGQMLVLFFSLKLGWLPTGGMSDSRGGATGWLAAVAILPYLCLPAISLGTRELAATARISKGSTLNVLSENYLMTARAKGLSVMQTIRRHVLRNAALPTLASFGYRVGLALAGSVTIEVVFSWPGIGRLLFQGIKSRDNGLVIGIIVVLTIMIILVNMITELLYVILDPRIKSFSETGAR